MVSLGLCIGLDAHAKTCTYKVKDDDGHVVEGRTIPSTPEALTELATKYPHATVIVEASSVHEWIYDHLTERGIDVFPCHPVNIRRTLGKKNDEVDAGFLVDAYRVNVLPRSYVPPKPVRELRQLARHRTFLTQERTRFKNRVHAILKRKGVHILDDDGEDVPDIFAKKHRSRLLAVENEEILVLLDLIEAVETKLKASEKKIEGICSTNPDLKNLMTIPGFGPLVALGLYAEIGEVNRFRNAEALTAYFGLVPWESQSGEHLARGHITKRGNGMVRWLLTQAAWRHVHTCPKSSLSKDYKRLAKRIGKKKAAVMVARKLCKVAYWLLKEQREFQLNG